MFKSRTIRHPSGFDLTDGDKENLDFLLKLAPEELLVWIEGAIQEDLEYAREITHINHILNIDNAVKVDSLEAAKWVLQKYIPYVKKPVAKQNGLRRIATWLRNLF